jgi:predicted O-methyltransferase YrrM
MYSAIQLAKKYARYYWRGLDSKGHGVHSPFVFDFIKLVKNDKKEYPAYTAIEQRRAAMLADKTVIAVEDFGAGSGTIKTKDRMVSRIAASSLKPRRFGQLLHRMVGYYKPDTIVELGTSFGISTAYLASANPSAKVYTLEGASSIAAIAASNFSLLQLPNIQLVKGSFDNTFTPLLDSLSTVDLAFIDGNHKKLPTLQYFEQLLEKRSADSIFIFDDIHWSSEMEEAWEIIKAHNTVTLSIDLFFIGIVFFKSDFKVKQHFTLRF